MTEGLIGVLVGALISGFIGIIIESHKYVNNRISIAQAFCADMDTLRRIIDYRGYINFFKEAAKNKTNICISVNQNYFEIFEKNCSKIGVMPYSLVLDVVKFYTYAKSCLEDINLYCTPNSPKDSFEAYSSLAEIMESMTIISQGYDKKVEEFIKEEKNKFFYKFANKFF